MLVKTMEYRTVHSFLYKDFAVLILYLVLFVPLLLFLTKDMYFIHDDYDTLNFLQNYIDHSFLPFDARFPNSSQISLIYFHLLFYSYKFFGTSTLPMFLFTAVVHSINAFFLYRLLCFFFSEFRPLAFWASLLFLFYSGFHENFFYWGNIVHHVTLFFILASFLSYLKYIQTLKISWSVFSLFAMVLAFLTRESGILIVFYIAADFFYSKRWKAFSKLNYYYLSVSVIFLAYMGLVGSFFHGSGEKGSSFDLIISMFFRENIPFVFLNGFFELSLPVFGFLPFMFQLPFIGIILGILLWIFLKTREKNKALFFLTCLFLSFLPFLPAIWDINRFPSRYQYYSEFWWFLFLFLGFQVFFEKRAKWRYPIFSVLILLHVAGLFLIKEVVYQPTTEIFKRIIEGETIYNISFRLGSFEVPHKILPLNIEAIRRYRQREKELPDSYALKKW